MTSTLQTQGKKSTIASKDPDNSSSITVLLSNTVMGAGILSVSYALSKFGLVLGFIIMISMGLISGFTFNIIVDATHFTQKFTFRELIPIFFNKQFGWFVEFATFCLCVGVNSAYLIIFGDYFVDMIGDLTSNPPDWLVEKDTIRLLGLVLVMFPLSSLPDLSFLASSSFISVMCIFVVVVSVIISFFSHLSKGTNSDNLDLIETDFTDIIKALPLFTTAFSCHINAPSLYSTLNNRTPKIMSTVTYRAFAIIFVVYGLLGFAGYLIFGRDVQDNILNSFTGDVPFYITVSRVGMCVVILTSFPLLMHPMRIGFVATFGPIYEWCMSCVGRSSAQMSEKETQKASVSHEATSIMDAVTIEMDEAGEDDEKMPATTKLKEDDLTEVDDKEILSEPSTEESSSEQSEDSTSEETEVVSSDFTPETGKNLEDELYEASKKKMTKAEYIRHIIITALLSAISYIIAVSLPSISDVFGIFSSIFGSFLCYMVPGFLLLKLRSIDYHERKNEDSKIGSEKWYRFGLPNLLIIGGTVFGCLAFYNTVKDL